MKYESASLFSIFSIIFLVLLSAYLIFFNLKIDNKSNSNNEYIVSNRNETKLTPDVFMQDTDNDCNVSFSITAYCGDGEVNGSEECEGNIKKTYQTNDGIIGKKTCNDCKWIEYSKNIIDE